MAPPPIIITESPCFIPACSIPLKQQESGSANAAIDKLKSLGRIHNGDEAIRAMDIARKAGFTNINIDLMHGLPKQTLEVFRKLQLTIPIVNYANLALFR